ncbi:hypothetical protein GCM10010489_16530 [Microbacterium saperdae]|nr:hypothetical protein GCM10010489_16530 [Microbacterium saperdae]
MKRHRTPRAGTVSAETDHCTRVCVDAQQRRHQRSRFGDHRRAERSGIAVDQLRVQPWPRVVTVAFMSIAAGETR